MSPRVAPACALCLLLPYGHEACAVASGKDLAGLLAHGTVVVKPQGTGGHSGECVRVELTNTSPAPVSTTLPAGWVFVSTDTTVQDLLVVRDEVLTLAPGVPRTVTCRAFCCEATMSGPGVGATFTAGAPGSEGLRKLAAFVAQARFPDSAVQQAVWCVSDLTDIAAIDCGEADATQRLRAFVATLTGRRMPWHTTTYATPAPGRVFDPRPQVIHGNVTFIQRSAGVLTIVVKDASGNTVHVVDEGQDLLPGEYDMGVRLTVRGWPKGTYTLCFATDGVLFKKQDFEL